MSAFNINDSKSSAAIYIILAVIIGLCPILSFGVCAAAEPGLQNAICSTDQQNASKIAFPQLDEVTTVPAVPAELESATLVLTKPQPSSLVNYTDRGFNESVEAAIAWWMEPTYLANTSEFRAYQRASPQKRADSYSPDKRLFFDFVEKNLDAAMNASVLNETIVLFRGISPFVADMVINSSEYVEPAFASTSYDVTISMDLFGPRSKDGYLNALVLQRQAGEKTLYVNEDEREFILPRGTRWDVIRAVNVENLTVETDFPLHNSTLKSAEFEDVRLIYIREIEE